MMKVIDLHPIGLETAFLAFSTKVLDALLFDFTSPLGLIPHATNLTV
jgi:hypothetical protein